MYGALGHVPLSISTVYVFSSLRNCTEPDGYLFKHFTVCNSRFCSLVVATWIYFVISADLCAIRRIMLVTPLDRGTDNSAPLWWGHNRSCDSNGGDRQSLSPPRADRSSYLPDGAHMCSHLIMVLGPHESTLQAASRSVPPFCTAL